MESVGEAEGWGSHADRKEMDAVFQLCRRDDWRGVLERIENNPWISVTPMIMDNSISTTCLHQAITSKANIQERAAVVRLILQLFPRAARIKNGYGSLPLHVIAQRNTKMKSETKEELIFELVRAYTGALVEEGGVGKRTPLHIIFTDYVSPRLTKMMVDNGGQACFIKDKKGYLPAHVACSRHCSPEKLRMLLAVNPSALHDTTADGETLLSLATSTATKSHPNYALIDELHRQFSLSCARLSALQSPIINPNTMMGIGIIGNPPNVVNIPVAIASAAAAHRPDLDLSLATPISSGSDPSEAPSRDRLDSNESWQSSQFTTSPPPPPVVTTAGVSRKKRKSTASAVTHHGEGDHSNSILLSVPLPPLDDPVGLLLHFSRNQPYLQAYNWDESSVSPVNIAKV